MISRRDAIKALAVAPAAASTFHVGDAEAARAADHARAVAARAGQSSAQPAPDAAAKTEFFTAHELATITVLVDIIIPADERSPSASAVGVPAFIDFTMVDQPARQLPMRGGLAWLDYECLDRFGTPFVDCAEAERLQVVDDIAWPARTPPHLSHGAAFFGLVRDLTATGFFTTRQGIDDLQYQGNTFVREWTGAPRAAIEQLGVDTTAIEHWYKE
jgi:hypothetical protein